MSKERCKISNCWHDAEPNSDMCSFHLREQKWKDNHRKKLVFVQSTPLAKRTVQPYDYRSYLNSEAWKLKSETKKRENPRCSLCNRKSQVLHAHHRTYVRLGNENAFDLTVLCNECHDWFHRLYEYDDKLGCFAPRESAQQSVQRTNGGHRRKARKGKSKSKRFAPAVSR